MAITRSPAVMITETARIRAQVALVAATPGTLLAANANRVRASINNQTAGVLYVIFGDVSQVPSATNYDFAVAAGAILTLTTLEYTGAVQGFSTGGGAVGVSEAT